MIRGFFARTKQPLLQEWLVELAKRIARRVPVKLGFLMGLSALVRPRTRGWGKARAAIEEYVKGEKGRQRDALGLAELATAEAANPSRTRIAPAESGAGHVR